MIKKVTDCAHGSWTRGITASRTWSESKNLSGSSFWYKGMSGSWSWAWEKSRCGRDSFWRRPR
jgi:hypothetical protein